MKPPKGTTIAEVKYLNDYKYLFTFSNGKESVVDFKQIITHGTALLGYLDKAKFKKVNVDKNTGDIYWGKDWDMCFHIEQYYNETVIEPITTKHKYSS